MCQNETQNKGDHSTYEPMQAETSYPTLQNFKLICMSCNSSMSTSYSSTVLRQFTIQTVLWIAKNFVLHNNNNNIIILFIETRLQNTIVKYNKIQMAWLTGLALMPNTYAWEQLEQNETKKQTKKANSSYIQHG